MRGLEPTQNLCSGLVERSCAVVITTGIYDFFFAQNQTIEIIQF